MANWSATNIYFMRMRTTRLISGFAVMGVLGCNQRSASGDVAQTRPAADTTVRGVVRVIGSDRFPEVIVRSTDTDQDVAVLGTLEQEIESLEGVELSVSGPAVRGRAPRPRRAVNVQRYHIIAVDGMPARAGVLTRRGGALWVAGARDTVELVAPPPVALAAMLGSAVYVAGKIEDGKLRVVTFGAIHRDSLP